jgi:hypothetical protein
MARARSPATRRPSSTAVNEDNNRAQNEPGRKKERKVTPTPAQYRTTTRAYRARVAAAALIGQQSAVLLFGCAGWLLHAFHIIGPDTGAGDAFALDPSWPSLAWRSPFGPVALYGSYLVLGFLAFWTHWLGHRRMGGYNNRWYRAHAIDHHVKLYPPSRFMIPDEELGSGDANAKFYIPSFCLAALFSWLVWGSRAGTLFVIVNNGFWMAVADYFHTAYHLVHHWFERFQWFIALREIHYIHHRGEARLNYLITDMSMDMLMGTFALT